MHSDIADLMDGDKRSCDNCHTIKESKFFPFKTKHLCLWCYEKINNKILHSVRNRLRLSQTEKSIKEKTYHSSITEKDSSKAISGKPSCPSCKSNKVEKKGKRHGRQRYVCKKCRRNWTEEITYNSSKSTSSKKITTEIKREVSLSQIKTYLKEKQSNSEPITFYYRDDTSPRKSDNYSLDDDYIYIRARDGRRITFRIDRIRKI